MIVIDASAMVEALVGRDVDDSLLEVLSGEIAAPHVLDVEVLLMRLVESPQGCSSIFLTRVAVSA